MLGHRRKARATSGNPSTGSIRNDEEPDGRQSRDPSTSHFGCLNLDSYHHHHHHALRGHRIIVPVHDAWLTPLSSIISYWYRGYEKHGAGSTSVTLLVLGILVNYESFIFRDMRVFCFGRFLCLAIFVTRTIVDKGRL